MPHQLAEQATDPARREWLIERIELTLRAEHRVAREPW